MRDYFVKADRGSFAAGNVGSVTINMGGASGPEGVVLTPDEAARARREGGDSAGRQSAADDLAAQVMVQWTREAAERHYLPSSTLSVEWNPADPELVDQWPRLAAQAASWPGGPPSDPAGWAEDPRGIAGEGKDLGGIITHRIPTRRLLVLGEPGSGKTVLLIRLLLDLLHRRAPGAPVPVMFSLASWDPRHDLAGWMSDQLRTGYRKMSIPVRNAEHSRRSVAEELIANGLVLPLLDGLDELPEALRFKALEAINASFPSQPLVVSSRVADYRVLVRGSGGQCRLKNTAGIQLLPLSLAQIAEHLGAEAGSPSRDRWRTVMDHLGPGTPLRELAGTPLGLFLIATVYTPPRAGESGAPDPDELCDRSRFSDRSALERHLFRGLIPAVYSERSRSSPWTAERSHRVLSFLAHHLQTTLEGKTEIAWWETHRLMRGGRLSLLAICGILFLFAYCRDAGVGRPEPTVQSAAAILAVFALLPLVRPLRYFPAGRIFLQALSGAAERAALEHPTNPGDRIAWSQGRALLFRLLLVADGCTMQWVLPHWHAHVRGLAYFALLIVVAWRMEADRFLGRLNMVVAGAWLMVLARLIIDSPATRTADVVSILFVVLGVAGSLEVRSSNEATVLGPQDLLGKNRKMSLVFMSTAGLFNGLFVYLGCLFYLAGDGGGKDFIVTFYSLVANALAAVAAIALFAFWSSFSRMDYGVFLMARLFLAARGRIPWRYMGFLRDAHQRGLLRQMGPVYQFRHIELQRHLADAYDGGLRRRRRWL